MHLTENVSNEPAQVEIDDHSICIHLEGRELIAPRLNKNLRTGKKSQPETADSIGQALDAIGRTDWNQAMLYQQLGYALMDFSKGEYRRWVEIRPGEPAIPFKS
ncbi:MAG: hypothetical protein P8L85_16190 [Rubripirellula sp.]|nr:hypothetical protein [Rubripirellula sp.]